MWVMDGPRLDGGRAGRPFHDEDVGTFPVVCYIKTTWSNLLISDPSYNVTLRHDSFSLAKD